MRLEILFQFIVPLTFLAIWALTSLLNRDTQPLPQRPARPGARLGPGSGQGAGTGRGIAAAERVPAEGPPQGGRARDMAFRAPGAPPEGEPRAAANLNDANVYIMEDEVVFVDPVTNRRIMSTPIRNAADAAAAVAAVRGGPKPQRATQPRKTGRGRRPAAPVRQTPAEPETHRALSDQVGRSMSLSRGRPLDLTPLSSKLTPLSASMTTTSSAPSRDLGLQRSSSGPALQAREVKDMLGTPTKLRETIVLTEILQPPVSMRRRLRTR